MAKKNGLWNVITMKLCPGAMGVRHFIPLLFVLSVLGLAILGFVFRPFWWLLGIELCLYFVLDVLFSLKVENSITEFLLIVILFPIFHVSYGVGSLRGIIKLFTKKYRDASYIAPRL